MSLTHGTPLYGVVNLVVKQLKKCRRLRPELYDYLSAAHVSI
jgi:hypothetical protein